MSKSKQLFSRDHFPKSAMLFSAVWSNVGWDKGMTPQYLNTGDSLWLKEAVNSADPITN